MFLRSGWLDSTDGSLVSFHTGVLEQVVTGHACLMNANGYVT